MGHYVSYSGCVHNCARAALHAYRCRCACCLRRLGAPKGLMIMNLRSATLRLVHLRQVGVVCLFAIASLSCGIAAGQGAAPPLFQLPKDRAAELPPEEPLWPDGAPGEKQIENADATPTADAAYLDRHI